MDEIMMKDILSKLSIADSLEEMEPSQEAEKQKKANECYAKLSASLNEEQQELLHDYWQAMREVVQATQKSGYEFGLRLGLALVKKLIKQQNRQKKKEKDENKKK